MWVNKRVFLIACDLFHTSSESGGAGPRTRGNKARCWYSLGARAAGPHPRRQARLPGDAGQRPALLGLDHVNYDK